MNNQRLDTASLTKDSVYRLNNGVKIPVLGFGTWQIKDEEVAYASVLAALRAGYRHIDTAEAYGNEEAVGRAIKDSGIPREEIFLTTKLGNNHLTYGDACKAIDDSLARLGLDYIDLYLIHWPSPVAVRSSAAHRNAEVYKAMEDAYFVGKIRALGVSNFHKHHLIDLFNTLKVKPMVNQIYVSPSDEQKEVVRANEQFGLLTVAYSPLGTGKLLTLPELVTIAAKYGKSVAQVLIRWSLDHGYVPLPKSVTTERIRENFDVFDFHLSVEDSSVIAHLHGIVGLAKNPDTTEF